MYIQLYENLLQNCEVAAKAANDNNNNNKEITALTSDSK